MLNPLTRVYQWAVIRRPGWLLGCLAALLVVVSLGIGNFKLDASSDSLTLESDRALDYFREITSRYNSGDILVVTYTPEEPLFSDASLDRLQSLSDELSQVQGVASTMTILDVPMLYSPPLGFGDLSDDLPKLRDEAVDMELAKQEFHQNPIYKNTLVGPDNQTTAVLLNLKVNHDLVSMVRERDALYIERREGELSQEQQQRLEQLEADYLAARTAAAQKDAERVAEIRQIVAGYEQGADMFVGGATMITSDMIDFIKSDLVTFGIGILLFILVTLVVIFRHPKLVFLPLVTCVTTALFMLGLLGWLDWRLTVISSNFVSLLLIITMAISIHLLVRYQENCRVEGDQPESKRVFDTVMQMARPCFYTAITTIVAFVSLVVSDIRPVIDFGWMMTIGVAAALVLTFLIIPAGLLVMGGIGRGSVGPEDPRYMSWLARQVLRFPSTILVAAVVLALGAAYGISQLKVENRFIDYFKSDTEIHQGMQVIDNNLGGTMTLDLVLDAPEGWDDYLSTDTRPAGGADDDGFDDFGEDPFGEDPFGEDPFAEPGDAAESQESYWWNRSGFRTIERYHNFLEAQPEIGKVTSIATLYKVARDLLGGGELNDIELAFMRQSLSPELHETLIEPYYAPDIQQVRISTRVKESTPGLSRDELIGRVQQFGVDELGLQPQNVQATGLMVLYNNMLQSLFSSQIKTLGAVFVAIMLMFMVLFRSLLVSLIAIVPNMLAAGIVLGLMGLAGIPLDIMTTTIAAITVGMGVDHAIHYIHRFRKEYAEVGDYTEALKRSHRTIGRALLYAAITIIIGFSVLALSNFIPSIYFGLLTSFAMLAATIASLLLLPRLLVLLKPFGKE